MSKIKKAAAIVAASVLCMSMSVGVFASSPTDPEQLAPEVEEYYDDIDWCFDHWIYDGSAVDKDGNRLTASNMILEEDIIDILQDEEQVKNILTDAGYEVKDDQNVVVIGAGDLTLIDWDTGEKQEVPEGGIDLTLNLGYSDEEGNWYTNDELKGLKEGDTLYILHQKADGTWEVLEGTVALDDTYGTTAYKVTAHFDSLSPVAIIKVLSNGSLDVQTLDKKGSVNFEAKKDGNSVKLVKTTTVKKSPKTGN